MAKKPNILWVMTDQHHADCLGFQGRQVRTPNLDGLFAEGTSFDGAYCQNPICAPSRASYLSGQYQHTHGMQGNNVHHHPSRNPDSVAALFRRSGYRTGLFGKAHLPGHWVDEGFERVRHTDLADADRGDPTTCHYFQYLVDHDLVGWYEDGTPRPKHEGDLTGSAPAMLPYEHSIEHFTGEETLRFLQDGEAAEDERPFFIQMSFQRPHAPMNPAPESFDLYDPNDIELPASAIDWFERRFAGKPEWQQKRLANGNTYPLAHPDPIKLKTVLAAYYALITCIDQEIGRVFQQLREAGQWDNTVVVFCADHGDFAGDHGLFHKNFGIYECLHRVPMILKAPGVPAATRRTGIVEAIDLYPTFTELAGLETPECVEGTSMLPVARGESEGKPEALCEWSWLAPVSRINALRTPTHRLVYYNREHGGELYDHRTDPGEIDNLWNDPAHRDVQQELLERLFDRVNQYRCQSEMSDDRRIGHEDRWQPSTLIHKRKKDWVKLHETYETPDEARGPWPS